VLSRRKHLAERQAQREAVAGAEGDDGIAVAAEDDEIADEVRRERAYAAAASVPARTPKASQNRKPAGKPGRPTGKRKR
jgi:preprotein translocase subunit SecF